MSGRILIIADIDNVYTKRYTERVLLPDGWEVILFPIWGQTGRFDGWFREHGASIYRDTYRLPVVRHIPRLRMWARVYANARALRKLGPFDAIHNHYLSQRDLALGRAMKRRFPGARWICTFWGSDLLRAAPGQLQKMASPLRACDTITVITEPHVARIRDLFGASCADKTAVCDFGVDLYDDIDRVRPTADRAACKARFGLPPDRPLICLGYNASPPHRHVELLDALSSLPPETLTGWSVCLQMTYGKPDDGYLAAVRNAAAKLPCHTLILTEFLGGEESAYLRLAADAFVLAMPTDAFSSSLQEYLYAGARVLCGAWLSYPQLDAMGIRLERFSSIAQVPALLKRALGQPVSKDELQKRSSLRERYSWDALSDGWKALYPAP
jgi:glycosyltransferase involved in cell wall biosynthesis